MKKTISNRVKAFFLFAGGGLILSQTSSAGGCLPNNYFSDLGGSLIESVATTFILDAVDGVLNPADES